MLRDKAGFFNHAEQTGCSFDTISQASGLRLLLFCLCFSTKAHQGFVFVVVVFVFFIAGLPTGRLD